MLWNPQSNYNINKVFFFLSFYFIFQDGRYNTTETVSVKVSDVQNRPPIFVGSLTGIVDEDAPVVSYIKIEFYPILYFMKTTVFSYVYRMFHNKVELKNNFFRNYVCLGL